MLSTVDFMGCIDTLEGCFRRHHFFASQMKVMNDNWEGGLGKSKLMRWAGEE